MTNAEPATQGPPSRQTRPAPPADRPRNENADPQRVLTKHDAHNLEAKFDFTWPTGDGRPRGFEIACVLPASLSVRSLQKGSLWGDFRARTRIAIGDRNASADASGALDMAAKHLDRILATSPGPSQAAMIAAVRNVGFHAGEFMKCRDEEDRRALFLIYSLANASPGLPSGFAEMAFQIRSSIERIVDLRQRLEGLRSADPSLHLDLSDYLHHQCVRYLASVSREFEKFRTTPRRAGKLGVRAGGKRIAAVLNELCAREKEHVRTHKGDDHEYLMRLSSLKRFFHSGTFVDVSREEHIRRYSEPLASGAAVLAACAGAVIQHLSESGLSIAGFGGAGVVGLGIFLYALRDRLKDRGRSMFSRWLERRLPDVQETLFHEGTRIGAVRRWLNIGSLSRLSDDLPGLRSLRDSGKVESQLDSEVLTYRERMTLDRPDGGRIHHIVRINLRRYLKYMDDSHKEISFLTDDGLIEARNVARVYPFLCFIKVDPQGPDSETTRADMFAYRVLVNKDGIQSVDALS